LNELNYHVNTFENASKTAIVLTRKDMNMETYTYKGYQGSVETSIEDGVLHGKIMFINDLVTYEATTLKALEKQFESAVNDYLASCKKLDKEPDKTLTGQFNVRVGEDLHRRIALNALQTDTSINAVVVTALTAYLNETRKTTKPIQRQRLVA
jgi:predicted HicB family RNase H-like nuclease